MSQWKRLLRIYVGDDRANELLSRAEYSVTQKPEHIPTKKEVIAEVVKSEAIKTAAEESDNTAAKPKAQHLLMLKPLMPTKSKI